MYGDLNIEKVYKTLYIWVKLFPDLIRKLI